MDSAAYSGYSIPPFYDSLVGKLIVHGKSRNECLMRLRPLAGKSPRTSFGRAKVTTGNEHS